MSTGNVVSGRGRPRVITRERLAEAGMAIGLPKLTVVGVAAQLGVSHMAIYKHVSGLDELKRLVAEEVFTRWHLPLPEGSGREALAPFLEVFSESMWQLVASHAGIAPYMLREDMITPAMLAKMGAHQQQVAQQCGITFAQSHWLLFTVAYHCVAVADTVLPLKEPVPAAPSRADAPCPDEDGAAAAAAAAAGLSRIRWLYARGARALVLGALATLDEIKD